MATTEQQDSPMVEIYQNFPHESAIVMQRGIELGVVCNCLLVCHCALLIRSHWDANTRMDTLLRAMCFVRLALVAPRPLYWLRTWRLFASAGCLPTASQVAQRLVDIYAHPFVKERFLLLSYYVWLVGVSAFVCVVPPRGNALAGGLWWHCVMSFMGIVLHRVSCVALFAILVQGRRVPRRGAPAKSLDKYTKKVSWTGALQQIGACLRAADGAAAAGCEGPESCSICLACYAMGEQLRVLSCGHYFHRRCVDTWLTKHRNSCPLCLFAVGPVAVG